MTNNIMPLRKFTDVGIKDFQAAIESLGGPIGKGSMGTTVSLKELQAISQLAHREDITVPVGNLEIDSSLLFQDRLTLARYLFKEVFKENEDHLKDMGLWAWLSALYFVQLCRPSKNDTYLLGSSYRYVVDQSRLRYYRHLVRTAVLRFSQYGESSRLFLSQPVYESGELTEQTQKIAFLNVKSVRELADALYFDTKTLKPRKGFRDKLTKGGSLRRMIQIVVPQLTMNYDPYEMQSEHLMNLLPKEFKKWKDKAAEQ
ncbi:MAG: hypothetical protein DI628_01840 [Blastochloris viridis]|uniref:Uncharacterized protein n=1 Tax=Blastochloris viridis TaxID=1079 RepID=A0A6N4RBI9_BLAVI|nr:MAG: hypothetical protein DI628_01840 [Blastochloris viridis]